MPAWATSARNQQFERELFDARTALPQARVELVGSRTDERRSRRLALRDDLTLLPYRSFFGEWIEQTLVKAMPLQQCFAVLYLDLDSFKPINDSHGHAVGGELPCIVASRLARAVLAPPRTRRGPFWLLGAQAAWEQPYAT